MPKTKNKPEEKLKEKTKPDLSEKKLLIPLYNQKGDRLRDISLPKDIFGCKPNPSLISQVVRVSLAREKPKLASTKTRGEVAGGGRKPYRQKGTGRSRAGSIRSPIWRGGGIAHGPKPSTKTLNIPKKMRQQALSTALSGKYSDKAIVAIDKLDFKEPKTKKATQLLDKLPIGQAKHILLVLDNKNETTVKSFRNIENVEISRSLDLNILSVLKSSGLIFTLGALEKLKERLKEKV